MSKTKQIIAFCVMAGLIVIFAGGCGGSGGTVSIPTDTNAVWLAVKDAYIFSFPLMIMDATKKAGTNTVKPTDKKAPVNQFLHVKTLATAKFREVVTPNVDTVYSQLFIVNAYYQPLYNSIVIPAGILGGDFYNPEASREFNLAGIGATIGHEVSHAFDPAGAQFDMDGNFVKWWTNEDFAAFNQRTAKLIDHISNMIILEDGTKWRGSYTQGETVADIVVVKVVLKIAARTEGFNYKEFFASHALGWKLVATPEMISELAQTDVPPVDVFAV